MSLFGGSGRRCKCAAPTSCSTLPACLPSDIQQVYRGNNAKLEKLLETEGPFWGRQYVFVHKGRPLTCIHEVFSPRLTAFLGQPECYAQVKEDPSIFI